MRGLNSCGQGLPTLMILVVSVLCFFTFQPRYAFPSTTHLDRTTSLNKDPSNEIAKRVPIPFGQDQPYNLSSFVFASEPQKSIRKRTLSYFDAICKGEKHLLNIARAAFKGTGSGQQFSVQDIENAGWTVDSDFILNIPAAMRPALQEFGIGADADAMKLRYATQDKEYTSIGGNLEQSTMGQYYQIYNPAGKAIVCPDNAAPGYFLNGMREARDLPEIPEGTKQFADALPKINRWSDVVWGIWTDTAGGAAGSLQYIFRDNIVTPDTRAIIDEAIAPKSIGDLAWPGKTFSQDELAGQALMGTPHGAGIAWMLIDHADVMGKRDIDITVYSGAGNGPGESFYYLLFNLKP